MRDGVLERNLLFQGSEVDELLPKPLREGLDADAAVARTVFHERGLAPTTVARKLAAIRALFRVLAALGPRMLELSRDEADGAHPYFVPVEHTSFARQVLGPGPLLIPEMAVVLETDRAAALAAARAYASHYLQLPNYVNNLRRFGYGTEDTDRPGSERLIDALIPHGPSVIAARVRQHLDAGADHVLLGQPIGTDFAVGVDHLEQLAPALAELP